MFKLVLMRHGEPARNIESRPARAGALDALCACRGDFVSGAGN